MQASSPFFSPVGRVSTRIDRMSIWLVSLILALSLVGYPIASSAAALVDVENVVFNAPYRGIVALLSGLLILLALAQGSLRIPMLIGLFLFVYLLRMITNFEIIDQAIIERDILLFLVTVAAPALAMGSSWRHYDERNAALVLTVLGGLACSLVVFALISGVGLSEAVDLDSRNWLEALNPITIAYTGAWTALAAYAARQSASAPVRLLILWPVLGLGLMTFLLGGSRGPIIGVALFFGLRALIRGRGALATLLFLASAIAVAAWNFADLAVFQRFTDLATDPSVLDRLRTQQLALNQGLDSPLWGSVYLEITTLSYPHNLLIEAMMALGLLGAVAMLVIQINLIRNAIALISNGYRLMPALAAMALANAWISGSLFTSSDFFIMAIACALVAANYRSAPLGRQRDRAPTQSLSDHQPISRY